MRQFHSPWLLVAYSLIALVVCAAPSLHARDDATRRSDRDNAHRARGKVTQVRPDEKRITLQTPDGKDLHIYLDSGSRIQLNHNDAKLSELKDGTMITVRYTTRDGKNYAVLVANHPTLEEVRREIREALQGTKNYAFQQKEEYTKKLETQLKRLDEQVEELKSSIKDAAAKPENQELLKDLQAKRAVVQEKLDKVRTSSAAAWEEVKAGLDAAVEDLMKSFQKARTRFD